MTTKITANIGKRTIRVSMNAGTGYDNRYKGGFDTLIDLQTLVPVGQKSRFAFVEDECVFYAWKNGAWTASSGGSGGVIEGTYEQLLALKVSESIVPGQKYKMTDYKTSVVHKYDLDLISGNIEALYLTGNDIGSYSNIVQSVEYPNDVIHYDITKKSLTSLTSLDIEGFGPTPPQNDNSFGVLFDPVSVVIGDTFTLEYSQSLTLDETVSIFFYEDNNGEVWERNGTLQSLIDDGDIQVIDLGGFQYEIKILFLGDQGNPFDFSTIESSGQFWQFQIRVELVLDSNTGTIYYRYNPDQNITAKFGANAGVVDTADWRAAIQRRYKIVGRSYYAPKPQDYTLSVSGVWGTITDTFVVDTLDYTMLPSAQYNSRNVTLVGGLAQKNITVTGGVNGMYSPASDGDSYYQGSCSGITIEDGSSHSCIVLGGMTGMTATNSSTISDIVYKTPFSGLQFISSYMNKNWITPDTQTHKGWIFDNITLTGGLSSKTYGSLFVLGGRMILRNGTINGMNLLVGATRAVNEFDFNDNIATDLHFGSFINTEKNKFDITRNITSFLIGGLSTLTGNVQGNDVIMSGNLSGSSFRSFTNNIGSIIGCVNSNMSLSSVDGCTFEKVTFNNNTLTSFGILSNCFFRGPVTNNNFNGFVGYSSFYKGMSGNTVNDDINTMEFLGEVQNQTWNASWEQSIVHTAIVTAKTWTVPQNQEDIFGREGSTLYKRKIVLGALDLQPVL